MNASLKMSQFTKIAVASLKMNHFLPVFFSCCLVVWSINLIRTMGAVACVVDQKDHINEPFSIYMSIPGVYTHPCAVICMLTCLIYLLVPLFSVVFWFFCVVPINCLNILSFFKSSITLKTF